MVRALPLVGQRALLAATVRAASSSAPREPTEVALSDFLTLSYTLEQERWLQSLKEPLWHVKCTSSLQRCIWIGRQIYLTLLLQTFDKGSTLEMQWKRLPTVSAAVSTEHCTSPSTTCRLCGSGHCGTHSDVWLFPERSGAFMNYLWNELRNPGCGCPMYRPHQECYGLNRVHPRFLCGSPIPKVAIFADSF